MSKDIRSLIREVISLCALGDVDETTEAYGWGALIADLKKVLEQDEPTLGSVSAGWVLVPREPTPEMLHAIWRYSGAVFESSCHGAWSAALSVAPPTHPAQADISKKDAQ